MTNRSSINTIFTCADVIGMVIFVSSIGFVEGYKKRIPYRNILIIDGRYAHTFFFWGTCLFVSTLISYHYLHLTCLFLCSFKPVMLVIKDKMLTDHLTKWARCSNEQPIIVATMLRAKREEGKLMCPC